MERPFHIYQSSAGSGKTYTLTFSYLKIALANPDNYRNVLGVTFTNKATEEMKSRIVSVLSDLALDHDHPMKAGLLAELDVSTKKLKIRSGQLLSRILHEYGRFSILTIDSFFHQVIRSFAREMGLQGTFSIDLDTDKVLQEVVDNLLAKLGDADQRNMRSWLTQFAEEKVEDGKSWDFRTDIIDLAREILKDQFKLRANAVFKLDQEKNFFGDLLAELKRGKDEFERHSKRLASEGLSAMATVGGVEAFSRKSAGPAGLFAKVVAGEFAVSETRRLAVDDVHKWLTKKSLSDATLLETCQSEVMPVYGRLVAFIDENLRHYQSISEVYRYFYTFGILSALSEEVEQYRVDNDVMLIADLPDFLRQVIDGGETPFIYEKVGSLFHHFLIDEFQDTSLFQWNNFRPLVKNSIDGGEECLVVGDTKQSIYRWRGGDWRLLEKNVAAEVGEYAVQKHQLSSNWRSDTGIVDFNNWLFSGLDSLTDQYFEGLEEELMPRLEELKAVYTDSAQIAERTEEAGLVSIQFLESEGNWKEESIAKAISIVEDLQRSGYSLRDIALLTRSQQEGRMVANAFMQYKRSASSDEGLRYDVVSSEALYLYASPVVRFLVSMLKWLDNESNTIVLAEWVHEYKTFILDHQESHPSVTFRAVWDWKEVVPPVFLQRKDHLKTLPLYEMVEELIRTFHLNDLFGDLIYLQGFQDAVLDYSKTERGDLPAFLEWWENVRKDRAIQVADDTDAIKILTIHKAKGLEFPFVIVPFLSWKLDHDTYGKQEIIWVAPKGSPEISKMPAVPLRYGQKLKETYWSEEYWSEKMSAYLDGVNLLYVALTRAQHGLFAFGTHTKTNKLSTVGDLCFQAIEHHESWNPATATLRIGTLRDAERGIKVNNEFHLRKYEAQAWRDKVSVQLKGAMELSSRAFDVQKEGIDFHKKLSEIARLEDSVMQEDVRDFVFHPEVRPYFEDIDEIKREVPILMPGGMYYRIDRMVRKGAVWFVIDFKTGQQRPKDEQQVMGYMDILKDMGYQRLKGVVIYVQPVSVRELI